MKDGYFPVRNLLVYQRANPLIIIGTTSHLQYL